MLKTKGNVEKVSFTISYRQQTRIESSNRRKRQSSNRSEEQASSNRGHTRYKETKCNKTSRVTNTLVKQQLPN